MADGNSGGSNTSLALIVGALVVAVIGFFVLRGGMPGQHVSGPSITVQAPATTH